MPRRVWTPEQRRAHGLAIRAARAKKKEIRKPWQPLCGSARVQELSRCAQYFWDSLVDFYSGEPKYAMFTEEFLRGAIDEAARKAAEEIKRVKAEAPQEDSRSQP